MFVLDMRRMEKDKHAKPSPVHARSRWMPRSSWFLNEGAKSEE